LSWRNREGAKPWFNWLQEGSLGATQEGVDGVVCWRQEGGLVVVQVDINGTSGLAVELPCGQR
jgi:hypothetical protein